MKRLFCILTMVLIMAVNASAFDRGARYSGNKTSSAAVMTVPGNFYGIIVSASSTAVGSLAVYDNASAASGTQILPTIYVQASSGNDRNQIISPPTIPVECFNGIYVNLTTTTGTINYSVYYLTP